MVFFPFAHRLLDGWLELPPWLDMDVDVGDALQSLQV